MNRACIGLGSNVDADANLAAAVRGLRRVVVVESVSSAWESPAVGVPAPDFVNAAMLVRSTGSETELVSLLKRLENGMGRARGSPSMRVVIDLDLLVFEDDVRRSELWSLPYRAVPAAELLPGLRCPETGETLSQAAARHLAACVIWSRPDVLLDAAAAPDSGAGGPPLRWGAVPTLLDPRATDDDTE
jgi:2-amino-4-hydroxy-6-hydroxymethyldihydropteridine diphosphokinase